MLYSLGNPAESKLTGSKAQLPKPSHGRGSLGKHLSPDTRHPQAQGHTRFPTHPGTGLLALEHRSLQERNAESLNAIFYKGY